jgi:hypothetical protein
MQPAALQLAHEEHDDQQQLCGPVQVELICTLRMKAPGIKFLCLKMNSSSKMFALSLNMYRYKSASAGSGGRPALRVVMRWEELSEDEIVRVPHHPFWMGHDAPPPPKAAVDFFKRVQGDLALSDGLRLWASELAGLNGPAAPTDEASGGAVGLCTLNQVDP